MAAYLDRFDFKSPLLKSMYAVTDGFSGLNGSWQTPGTGMNFLMHNMVGCLLEASYTAHMTAMLQKIGLTIVSIVTMTVCACSLDEPSLSTTCIHWQ